MTIFTDGHTSAQRVLPGAESAPGTPYDGLYGEAPPSGVPFSGFRCMKGRGFTSEYINALGNPSFGSVKRP